MNLSWLALALVAMQLLNCPKDKQRKSPNLTEFLSDDTKSMLDCFGKITSNNTTDKLGAIMQALSNPVVMNVAQSMFSKSQENEPQGEFANDEGYAFDKPSQEAKEFFRPIEHIADPEVKNKLYSLYDNWYLK